MATFCSSATSQSGTSARPPLHLRSALLRRNADKYSPVNKISQDIPCFEDMDIEEVLKRSIGDLPIFPNISDHLPVDFVRRSPLIDDSRSKPLQRLQPATGKPATTGRLSPWFVQAALSHRWTASSRSPPLPPGSLKQGCRQCRGDGLGRAEAIQDKHRIRILPLILGKAGDEPRDLGIGCFATRVTRPCRTPHRCGATAVRSGSSPGTSGRCPCPIPRQAPEPSPPSPEPGSSDATWS